MITSGGLYKKSDFLLDNLTKECYNITCDSRAAEGTGPVKPDNLRVCVRCQILRETGR